VDATWPIASTHDAISVPLQPEAPATVNSSSSSSVGGLLVAPAVNAVARVDTIMTAGRDANAGLDVAHDFTLTARVQVAGSRDVTRSVSAGVNMPPGSAVSVGVDAHVTANVVG